MHPPQGHKKKFESVSEKEMANYCDYCWEIGIPKTQEQFAQELVHYMDYYGLPNKFTKILPGNKKQGKTSNSFECIFNDLCTCLCIILVAEVLIITLILHD